MLREEPTIPPTPTTTPEAHRASRNRERAWRGTGIRWSFVAGIVLVAAIVAFIAQNGQQVEFEWLWINFSASLAVMLLATAVAAVAATALVGWIWRARRRHRIGHEDRSTHRSTTALRA